MSGLLSFLIGLLALAFMISVHEAGHFVMARLTKIEVEVFAIGFGKALKKWHHKETEIRLNLFPLGGYCRLKGSEELKEALDRGDKYLKGTHPGSLFAAPPWKRILTYLAGPLFNIILAFLFFTLFFSLPALSYADPNKIVVTADYPTVFNLTGGEPNAAQEGGILTGDIILKIDGVTTADFYAIHTELSSKKKGADVEFTLLREGNELTVTTPGYWDATEKRTLFGISSYLSNVVGFVDPLSTEAVNALEVGDTIIAAQGLSVENALDLVAILHTKPSLIELTVQKQDKDVKTIRYSPLIDEGGNIKLGFSLQRNLIKRPGLPLFKSFLKALEEELFVLKETVLLFPKMLRGAFKFDEVVGGPLRISFLIGESRQGGLSALIHLLALISASLAVANLLPLPGLDGGAIILNLVELLRGKSLPLRFYMRSQAVGFIILALLMFFVILGDLRFLLGG